VVAEKPSSSPWVQGLLSSLFGFAKDFKSVVVALKGCDARRCAQARTDVRWRASCLVSIGSRYSYRTDQTVAAHKTATFAAGSTAQVEEAN
jgi:hypothetical protein